MNKSILVLSKFDSFARVAKCIADSFAENGFKVDYKLISIGNKALSDRIYQEIGLPKETPVTTLEKLFQTKELSQYMAVYLGTTGGFILKFLSHIKNYFPKGTPRPLLITGYPGIIFRNKLMGFANRCGCDFVWLNSQSDLNDYQQFCLNFGLNSTGTQIFGYTFSPFQKKANEKIKHILFVEQAVIPASFKERIYLVKQLVSYASEHPEQEIIIKPRLIPGEKSIFTTKYHMEFLLKSLDDLPCNIQISYDNIQTLLEKADFCLTVGSTVALQSIWYKIPTGIIYDFGIRDEYGTDFFRESNCLVSLEDLNTNKFSAANQDWFNKHFTNYKDTINVLIQSVINEYERRRQSNDWEYNGNTDKIFSQSYLRSRINKTNKISKIKLILLTSAAFLKNYFDSFFQFKKRNAQ